MTSTETARYCRRLSETNRDCGRLLDIFGDLVGPIETARYLWRLGQTNRDYMRLLHTDWYQDYGLLDTFGDSETNTDNRAREKELDTIESGY